jgi:hypothetical protein
MQKVFGSSAFGVFTGAVTSAGTFYAMCINRVQRAQGLRFLVGSGILLCMVAILFLLPAMIAWNEGRARKRPITEKLYLHSFGFERIMTWSTRHPAPVLVASLLLTLFAGYHAWNVEFSDSVQDLRSPNNKGVRLQERIAKEFGASFKPDDGGGEGARRRDDDGAQPRRQPAARRLRQGRHAARVRVDLHLPAPTEDQQAVIATLTERAADRFDVARIDRTFRAALDRHGFRAGAYDAYLASLPKTLHPIARDHRRSRGRRPRPVRPSLRAPGGGRLLHLGHLHLPLRPEGQAGGAGGARARPRQARDGIEITGVNIASAEMRRIFSGDAWRAVMLGIALVTVLLWLDFKSVWLTTLANMQVFTRRDLDARRDAGSWASR